jgi:hypothetical protein
VKKWLPPSKAMSKETVTYNRRVGKWEVQQRKAGEKMEQTEVPNVKKDDTGRQDPLTVGKSHKITGTMSPSQGMPQGQAFSTMIPPPRQPWWNTPMGQWRPFWHSRFAEWSMRSQGSIPSQWICRCGNDMLWCHRESPPIYETCRPCFDAMRAAGIDIEAWKARVRREERDQLISEQVAAGFDAMRAAGIDIEAWNKARVRREERDQLISEQAAAAETAKTGQS